MASVLSEGPSDGNGGPSYRNKVIDLLQLTLKAVILIMELLRFHY